jgi:predicted N-acetyltransferase YhbS
MFTITTERAEDGPGIEDLLDRAFGPDRGAKISYRYRAGVPPIPYLQLVARDHDDTLVGTIRYWPILIGAKTHPALLLGPIAVEPARRGEGIGVALIQRSLDMAAWARHQRVLLVGDHAYYKQFGFAPATPLGIVMPDEKPERLLAFGLAAGAFDGVSGTIQPWRWVRRRGRKLTAA